MQHWLYLCYSLLDKGRYAMQHTMKDLSETGIALKSKYRIKRRKPVIKYSRKSKT